MICHAWAWLTPCPAGNYNPASSAAHCRSSRPVAGTSQRHGTCLVTTEMIPPAPPGPAQTQSAPPVSPLLPQAGGGAGFAGLLAELFVAGPAVSGCELPTVQAGLKVSPVPAKAAVNAATAQLGKAGAQTAPHRSRTSTPDTTAADVAISTAAGVVTPQAVPPSPPTSTLRDPAPQGASDQCPVQPANAGPWRDHSIGTIHMPTTVAAMAGSVGDAVPAIPAHAAPLLAVGGDAAIASSPAALASATVSSGPVQGQSPVPLTVSPASAPAAAPVATPVVVTAPASVASQLSPALVQLAHGPAGSAVILRLDPAGLGHVQVRIDRDLAGSPIVQVTAEHSDTLHLLVADQPQLHRALDNAGIAADGRTLSFALATTDGSTSGSASGNNSGSQNGGNGRPGRAPMPFVGKDEDSPASIFPGWLRAGVDITA